MPFDGLINDKHDKLRALAIALRDRSQWPADFTWNYSQTKHCAIGLARRVGILTGSQGVREAGAGSILILADALGLPVRTTQDIFFDLLPSGAVPAITPEMVADAIDDALVAPVAVLVR